MREVPEVVDIETRRMRLVSLSAQLLETLLQRDRGRAAELLHARLPAEWPADDDDGLLRLRLTQLGADPESQRWLLRVMVLKSTDDVVGHIGFHGPPDDLGFVEIGYSVLPAWRRRGLAREAVIAMLEAAAHDGVVRFRASIGPWNEPSLALTRRLGFLQAGVQWDEEDGEEYVFEVAYHDLVVDITE